MEKRQWAILGNWKKILKERYNLKDEPGIYLFYRTNENNEKCVYVGQAIKILTDVQDIWRHEKNNHILIRVCKNTAYGQMTIKMDGL